MPTWALILIILVVVAVVAAVATAAIRQRRTAALRGRFGSEYERTVRAHSDQRAAEAELAGRQRQRAKLDIKPLPEDARLRYQEQWRVVQERFVDQPTDAVSAADRLLHQVMADRGYPVGDFDAQSDLISVDHPEVVENYRVAHTIQERTDSGQASTEELRDALLRYRSLFDELLRADQSDERPARSQDGERLRDSRADEIPPAAAPDEAAPRTETVPAQRTTGKLTTTPEADDDPR